ncbi:MAG: hypothetical protein WD049_04505 [Candidatus Paceibacterota bacterium]
MATADLVFDELNDKTSNQEADVLQEGDWVPSERESDRIALDPHLFAVRIIPRHHGRSVSEVAVGSGNKTAELLINELQETCQFMSSPDGMAEQPAFLRLLALQENAIPHLLQQLNKAPIIAMVALRRITGDDPVSDEDRGNVGAMVAAWRDWGRQKGLL